RLPRGAGRLNLGGSVAGLLTRVRWSGGSAEPGPRVLRIGIGYAPFRLLNFGAEAARVEFPGTVFSYGESRAGLELKARPWVILRGGWSLPGDGLPRASGGLGLRFGELSLDYALTF